MRQSSVRGAVLLRKYLQRQGLTVAEFCRINEFCPVHIGRLLNGKRQRVSVDTAVAIEKASGVPVRSWARSERSEISTAAQTVSP